MLLGKRSRRPMNRTTSTTAIAFELGSNATPVAAPASDPQTPAFSRRGTAEKQRLGGSDFLSEADQFLRACSRCRRRLVPGLDIYMYRGDNAFCSLECRQREMDKDERREKCFLAAMKEAAQAPSNGETLFAL